MEHLKLHAGGKLTINTWTGRWSTATVDKAAYQYLFHPVNLGEGVTLADVFILLERSPLLQDIYAQCFARELLEEAKRGPLPFKGEAPLSPQYLEVYQQCGRNIGTGGFQGPSRPMLHAISQPLAKDWYEAGKLMAKAGEQCPMGVTLSSVQELLALPLKVSDRAEVQEVNLDSRQFGEQVTFAVMRQLTLGELFQAVLYELSWHGSPQERETVREELKAAKPSFAEMSEADFDADEQDLMALFGFVPFKKVASEIFHAYSDVPLSDLETAIRQLDDTAPAGRSLSELVQGKVSLKEKYAKLIGMELRRVIRELRADSLQPA